MGLGGRGIPPCSDWIGDAARSGLAREIHDNLSQSVYEASLADLGADVGIQVSCIIQEALTNVRKHTGGTRVWLLLEPHGTRAKITIKDTGWSFDPGQNRVVGALHSGLSILRERAESVGGRLELHSQPGEGTRVVLWMPRVQGG